MSTNQSTISSLISLKIRITCAKNGHMVTLRMSYLSSYLSLTYTGWIYCIS